MGPAAGDRVSEAVLDVPFRVAVMVAVWLLVMPTAVVVKLADVELLATVTDDGTGKLVLLLLSVTTEPPLGATPFKLTVQVDVAGVMIVEGLQLRELTFTKPTAAVAALKATVVAAKVAEV